jgi:NAD(P)-dependent dehydrogenase (short-subunit alcohol dehydrogenase family)
MELKDKVVLITGSSSGIGATTAIEFAKQGCKVVINYNKTKDGAENVLKEIEKLGGEALIVHADISKEKDIIRLFETAVSHFKTIDILINNAGIGTDKVPFMESNQSDLQELFDTNIIGAMLCAQHAAKIMKTNGSGKIINTTSIRGWEHGGRAPVYAATKAALNSFTRTLAKMVGPEIQVNAVAPGFVYTRNYEAIPKEMHAQFIEQTQLKRWVTTEEIADTFLFLARNDAMTGQVIYVDAGFTLK